MIDRFLRRVYRYKKAVMALVAAAFTIHALSAGGFTAQEAAAAQTAAFGVIAVYLAANEEDEEDFLE